MKNNYLKKILICVMYSVILFLQEQLLSFIPNFQLSFLLIMLVGSVLGFKWGNLVLLIYLMLDNLSYGSFMPYVFFPMLIGWEFTLIMGFIFRNFNKYTVSIIGILCSFIYSWSFIPFSYFFFHIDVVAYFLADIVFEIILATSTFLSIILLYNPLKKILYNQWEFLCN